MPVPRADRRPVLRRTLHLSRRLFTLLCLSLLVAAAVPGCGGCAPEQDPAAQNNDEQAKKKKKEKPKRDFEVASLRVEPYDVDAPGARNQVKPGHWLAAHVRMKANNFDFHAELETATVDNHGVPLAIEYTPYRMTISRPAALPKGQVKHFESTYYVPRRPAGTRGAWLQSKLRSAGGGREVPSASQMQLTTRMPDYQYYLVVLAASPERYGYLHHLPSIAPPHDQWETMTRPIRYFQVVQPKAVGRLPLPSHPLAWTSIAYLVWDDLDPEKLAPDQQQSLLDWLHWGGQLIISGPGSLDKLKGSFLEPFLPASFVQSTELDQAALEPLNAGWFVKEHTAAEDITLEPDKPLLGVEMAPHPQAAEIAGSGGLVLERRIGRGRTVVTAFPLADRRIVTWENFDSFFNGGLLRRPRREFRDPDPASPRLKPYVLFDVDRSGMGNEAYERDPRLSTMLRYFSRDVGQADPEATATGEEAFMIDDYLDDLDVDSPSPPDSLGGAPQNAFSLGMDGDEQRPKEPPRYPAIDDPHFAGYVPVVQSGMAGWNDYNGCPTAARASLREAAGISIPKADFVLKALGVYLLILVPANWAFFRLIGRVEWAWIAAPLIAVAGAVAVVRFAQLDIGFARARTEIAVLEVQADYPRAHLTRYTALYTSLSTAYDMAMSNASALAQPFAVNTTGDPLRQRAAETVQLRHDADNLLSGFQVASNSTGMLHAEQMFPLGGPLRLLGDERKGWRVENGSRLGLREVGVMRRTPSGRLELAWVGELAARTTVPVRFEAAPRGDTRPPRWDASPVMSRPEDDRAEQVSLWRLADLAAHRLRLAAGEVRLIGWTDDPLGGVQFRPDASQVTSRTLVLAHLRPAPLPPALPDINRDEKSRQEIQAALEDEFDNRLQDSSPSGAPRTNAPADVPPPADAPDPADTGSGGAN